MQRIITEPYIVEQRIAINTYIIYISNQGTIYVDELNRDEVYGLYKQIQEYKLNMDLHEREEALQTIDDILSKKAMRKEALENLRTFLQKNETIFSFASNVISIISSIMEMV